MPDGKIEMTTPFELPPNPDRKWGRFGEIVEGYNQEVFNEREVRASAGILFLFGFSGFVTVLNTQDFRLVQGFALFFLIDMIIRLVFSPKYSPTMTLGRLAVYWQRPEWVSARPKRLAWGLGFGLALTTCLLMGRLGAPVPVVLTMCGICLSVLFLEAAFGICVGCFLQQRLSNEQPELCPGDTCNYVPGKQKT
ncbi:DUF4395 domain-containing protein [Aurantimicrobium minutum]|jgi:hypothetical protein|uniref:DUF4395 domain-containing protein n=2 Tax=Aurantimicrobium TaxID=1705353 RepID=UPI00248EAD20|nr:DUF4395 domain-containing protein [Aurantimicrobium minutum]